jgi:superfamily II DNA/RNA helicase
MEEAPENGKESSHSAHANGIEQEYSPDSSPSDYFLFPKLKMKLKGLHFADVTEIQKTVTDELKKVFRNCTTAQKSVYMPMELILN